MTTNTLAKKVKLITLLGSLLHKYGTSAQRLEAALGEITKSLGIKGNYYITPTYLAFSIEDDDEQVTRHIRVMPGDTNLSMLQEVDYVATQINNNEIEIDEALYRLKKLELSKDLYSPFASLLCFGLTSSSLSIILGGGVNEVFASLIMGLTLGIISFLKSKNDKLSDIFEFVAAFSIMFLIYFLNQYFFSFNYQNALISGLIIIVPGLGITVAMSELATKNLVSGTARLMGAIIEFFKMSFGILLAVEFCKIFWSSLDLVQENSLSAFYQLPAIFMASFCFTIIFQAKIRDFPYILISGAVTFFSLQISSQYLSHILSLFIASFVIGFISNLFARTQNRPSAIMLVPGIILLVPGSVGLKGLNLIFQNNFIQGLTSGFQMFTLAITIVGGLFMANVVLNPRKHL